VFRIIAIGVHDPPDSAFRINRTERSQSNGFSVHDPPERAVVGIFPNEEAVYRLVGSILLEQNDEWAVQRARYMTLETITALGDDGVVSLPAVTD
jgi:hypothetical protein